MKFVKLTKLINKVSSEIASWFVFIMMLLAVVDVLGRYLFKHSIFGAQDLTQLMMVIVVFLGFGLQAEEDGNVRIEILYQYFSPKLKAVMNTFAWLIGGTIYSLVTYKLFMRALNVFIKQNASTMTLDISLAPFLLIAALGCGMLVLQMISNIILEIMVLSGKAPKTDALAEGGNNA